MSANRSIKSQVITYMIFGVSLMVLTIGIISASSVNSLIRGVMLDNALQISEGLATRSVFPILSGSNENAEEAMTQVKGFQSVVAARITLKDSTQTFSNMVKNEEVSKDQVAKLFSTWKKNDSPENNTIIDNDKYWIISTPVKLLIDNSENEFELMGAFDVPETNVGQEIIGYAQIIYNKKTLKSTQKRILGILFSVGFISVIVLGLFLHLGFIRLFEPLQKLVKNMQSTEKTGFYTHTQVRGAKEIQSIANAYNSMISSLHEHELALMKHRDELEDEVKTRTKEFLEARDAAILASKHKSEFMANMSHELRTPIQSITGYAELIAEEIELEGDPALLEDLDKIMANSTRLLSMINSLLDLAKIESGHMDVSLILFSLDELINSVKDTIEPLAAKNQNSLSIEFDKTIDLIYTDRQKLEHILINLLSNACKFTSNGSVLLNIKNTDSLLIFSVTDTGIGLTEEQQEYIFDEFKQVDSGNARLFGGTGLGLAICKKFAKLINGEISVTSELDKGSTFILEIEYQEP